MKNNATIARSATNQTNNAPRVTVEHARRLHISQGNQKTGAVPTINLMPGDADNRYKTGEPVSNVAGTCAGCCEHCKGECYAMRSLRYPSVVQLWGENTLLLREDPDEFGMQLVHGISEYAAKVKAAKAKGRELPPYVRLHSAGEIDSIEHLRVLVKVARIVEFQGITLYTYTKRGEWLPEVEEMPSNLVVNVSGWNNVNSETAYPQFIFDDGTNPELAELPHCPAVLKPTRPGGKGKPNTVTNPDGTTRRFTCADCGYKCAKVKPGERRAVYAH